MTTDLIKEVVQECQCTEERAISLLKLYENDVEEVKKHHQLLSSYTKTPIPIPLSLPHSQIIFPPRQQQGVFGAPVLSMPCAKQITYLDTPTSDDMTPSEAADDTPLGDTPSNVSSNGNDEEEWYFQLPHLNLPEEPLDDILSDDTAFRALSLARAVQEGAPISEIQSYLNQFERNAVIKDINYPVLGFAPIFYAVARNEESVLRLLIKSGANVNAKRESSSIPLLGFAVICQETLQIDTTTAVSILLSQGADPHVIPQHLFSPSYLQDPSTQEGQEVDADSPISWCSPTVMAKLTRAINLTQRYFLNKATKLKRPSKRRRQVARIKNVQGLLSVPYFMVGQAVAVDLLTRRLLSHLLMPSKHPLVLCFAGPSGHGKTELARRLGDLLTLNLEVVDCTTVTHEMELFGPRPGFSGHEKGSPLNNFLVTNARKPCIVFLDEFEKTSKEIHHSLLLPFHNGEYQDRRTGNKIDCSKTIWIMATNELDTTILDFYAQNGAIAGDEEIEKELSQQLREAFMQRFGAPVTGRVSGYIPFFPFTTGEQAVISHKFLLELTRQLRLPVSLAKDSEERLVGDIRLVLKQDGAVCTKLAEANYHQDLGARSLIAGVENLKRDVLDIYLDEDKMIQEGLDLSEYVIDLDGDEIVCRAAQDEQDIQDPSPA